VTVSRPKFIERRASRFLAEPVSVQTAAGVITVTTTLVVLASGVLMRVLDGSEYPTIGRGLWWAIQTVTTVGYGDVTPEHTSGRIVAVFLMLWGIAFVTIIVAVITSTFVSRAERERDQAGDSAEDRLEARFDELIARLDDIEKAVSGISSRRYDD
jgi:voltage-gated potassium channel